MTEADRERASTSIITRLGRVALDWVNPSRLSVKRDTRCGHTNYTQPRDEERKREYNVRTTEEQLCRVSARETEAAKQAGGRSLVDRGAPLHLVLLPDPT